MNSSSFRFLALLGVASTCGTMAHAQGAAPADNGSVNGSMSMQSEAKKRKFPRIGPEVGYQYFLDSKTRERFGSSVLSFGLGGSGVGAGLNGNVGVDFSLLRAEQTTGSVRDKAFLVILGPEYRRAYIPVKAIKAIKAQMRAQAEKKWHARIGRIAASGIGANRQCAGFALLRREFERDLQQNRRAECPY